MAELTIDLTYGSALFEAAKDTGQTARVMEEATEVLGILKQEPDLHTFMNYPAISANEKKAVIEQVFGGQICDLLLHFIYVLIDKRRTGHFEKMIKAYKKMMDQAEGLSYGTVYSVKPLDKERISGLEADISKLFQANVRLENEIDPKLMGGVKVLVEGKIIDMSIRKKFDDLGSQIKLNQGGKI